METPNKSSLSPEHILEIAVKRRWLLIIPFILAMGAGLYLAFTLPKVYQSQTLILVQPQRVPTDFVRSVVSSDINERISTISQQIMSRTNLEKIIDQFNLFAGVDAQKMYLEDQITNLRKRITVEVTSDRRKDTDAFSISFKGEDPERVMRVTNTLATYFIDENLKVREAQAVGTSDFLQDELDSMTRRLADLEETLKTYRMKNMGALPEQLETNLRILERLQEELNVKQLRLRDARQHQIALEKQISEEKAASQELLAGANLGRIGPAPPETGEVRLERLEQQLSDLQGRYTERHPDIVRLKKQIADLESELEKEAAEEPVQTAQAADPPAAPRMPLTNAGRALERQMADTFREIETLEFEIPKVEEKIRVYQQRVEQTPRIEQELLSIRRDYENIKSSYDSLLQRKLEAELAVNMEKKQKGEQFRILDPARVPTKPLEPDMKKLMLLSIAVGLGLGGGFIFLLEYMDKSYRGPEEIESELGLPVMATIPVLETPRVKWFKRVNWAFTAAAVLVALTLVAGFASLNLVGERQTKEFVRTMIGT